MLAVLLLPLSFKKPFPKEDRPFREPKPSSAGGPGGPGSMADPPTGGFSVSLLISSLALFLGRQETTGKVLA